MSGDTVNDKTIISARETGTLSFWDEIEEEFQTKTELFSPENEVAMREDFENDSDILINHGKDSVPKTLGDSLHETHHNLPNIIDEPEIENYKVMII